jgi:hypothetical protein
MASGAETNHSIWISLVAKPELSKDEELVIAPYRPVLWGILWKYYKIIWRSMRIPRGWRTDHNRMKVCSDSEAGI